MASSELLLARITLRSALRCAPTHQTPRRTFAAGVGRKRGRQKARAGAAREGQELHSAGDILAVPSTPKPMWGSFSSQPPSLQRVALSAAQREEVLLVGRHDGPSAAYGKLVGSSVVELDQAQVGCVAVLQDLWLALNDHHVRRETWQSQHTVWQDEHDTWKRQIEGSQCLEPSKAPHKAGAIVELPPEPPEPQAPTLQTHGCYIWGPVGGGKSLLMDVFVGCCGREGEDGHVLRVHFHEFMQFVHKELHRLRVCGVERTTSAVARQLASRAKVLAFDEFQITNIADALIVETLFDALFRQGVAVVMTTNRPPQDLYKDGLNWHLAIPQFLALLNLRGVTLHKLAAARDFRSPDIVGTTDTDSRLNGPWRDYISKADVVDHEVVKAYLRNVFAKASGSLTGEPSTVALAWGRSIAIDEVAGGVGCFTFSQLCSNALSADDYLRLADMFHTLVVTDVPRFSVDMHNEARRFTNLVDCFYERHARLIISADAPPSELLVDMQLLAEDRAFAKRGTRGPRSFPQSPFTLGRDSAAEAIGARSNGRVGTGDDEAATGANVSGVMSGAVASLQESGFAAKRAISRLLHMQSEEYLKTHQQHRLAA